MGNNHGNNNSNLNKSVEALLKVKNQAPETAKYLRNINNIKISDELQLSFGGTSALQASNELLSNFSYLFKSLKQISDGKKQMLSDLCVFAEMIVNYEKKTKIESSQKGELQAWLDSMKSQVVLASSQVAKMSDERKKLKEYLNSDIKRAVENLENAASNKKDIESKLENEDKMKSPGVVKGMAGAGFGTLAGAGVVAVVEEGVILGALEVVGGAVLAPYLLPVLVCGGVVLVVAAVVKGKTDTTNRKVLNELRDLIKSDKDILGFSTKAIEAIDCFLVKFELFLIDLKSKIDRAESTLSKYSTNSDYRSQWKEVVVCWKELRPIASSHIKSLL